MGAVDFQSLLDCLGFVVVPDIDLPAAVVADPFLGGFVKNYMKVVAAFTADAAASQPFQHDLIGDVKVDDFIGLRKCGQGFSLGNGPGETV